MNAPDISARLACEDLMVESYRLVDEGHASSVAGLFTDDGRFTVTGAVDVAGKAALAEFFSAREADSSRQTRHCLSNLSFNASSPGEATVRATLMLFVLGENRASTPSALADVRDRYRREGGNWRIAERTTTLVAGGA